MSTNANREDHEDRELSVQELETVSGGWFSSWLSLENYEQTQAAKTFKAALQGGGPSLTIKEVAERRRVAARWLNQRRTVMTAINAKSDELSSEELDAVSGGWFCFGCIAPVSDAQEPGGGRD